MRDHRTTPLIYQIFQHNRAPGLCCAVTRTRPVPRFVLNGAWLCGATLRDDGRLPFGFQPAPAREAVSALGYYLFQHPCESFSARHSRDWP